MIYHLPSFDLAHIVDTLWLRIQQQYLRANLSVALIQTAEDDASNHNKVTNYKST